MSTVDERAETRRDQMKVVNCKTRKEAIKQYPGAAVIKKVEGGYAIFDSRNEYETWRGQK